MKKLDVKKLVAAALLASFACVATMIITFPSGIGGYLNLGDCIVVLCGWLLGPVYGAFAAGIGTALADVFASYVTYAPATFVIKALMAVIAYYVAKIITGKERIAAILSGICAEIWMVLGYFTYEAFVLELGLGALAGVPGNVLQGVVGIVCAFLLKEFIDRKGLWKY